LGRSQIPDLSYVADHEIADAFVSSLEDTGRTYITATDHGEIVFTHQGARALPLTNAEPRYIIRTHLCSSRQHALTATSEHGSVAAIFDQWDNAQAVSLYIGPVREN